MQNQYVRPYFQGSGHAGDFFITLLDHIQIGLIPTTDSPVIVDLLIMRATPMEDFAGRAMIAFCSAVDVASLLALPCRVGSMA